MKIQRSKTNIFSDTEIPDIYITDYMQHLDGESNKIYIYMVYCTKILENFQVSEISKHLNIDKEIVKNSLLKLEEEGLVIKVDNGYQIVDIKEIEVNRIYIPKIEKKKNSTSPKVHVIKAINDTFFRGTMNLSWYTDIDDLINKYKFEDDVMIALFNYCEEKKGLNRRYVEVVAEAWHNKKIKTFNDLEGYFAQMENINKIKKQILKAMRLNRNLTQYEEEMLGKWINEYGYDFNIIEIALKKTISKSNPNFSYINGIINKWWEQGFKTEKDILENVKKTKEEYSNNQSNLKKNETSKKFENRRYDDLDMFYDNMK